MAQGSTLDSQEVCAGVIIIRIVAASTFANILTSSLVSSVISGGLFYWLTARKERNQFLRSKLEELFMAYQAYCKSITTRIYMPFMQAMAGKIDYNQALDLQISTSHGTPRDHETCEMIIRLYFNEFLPNWDELLKRLDDLNSVRDDFKRCYQEGEDTRRFIRPFQAAMGELNKHEEILRKSIINKAKKLTPPKRI